MTKEEIISAIEFGKSIVSECKARDEQVPEFVFERIIELYDKLVELINGEEIRDDRF